MLLTELLSGIITRLAARDLQIYQDQLNEADADLEKSAGQKPFDAVIWAKIIRKRSNALDKIAAASAIADNPWHQSSDEKTSD